jgi:hypothetical protein
MDLGLLMDPAANAAFQNLSPAATPMLARGEFLDSMPWYFMLSSLLFLGVNPKHGLRMAVLFGIKMMPEKSSIDIIPICKINVA